MKRKIKKMLLSESGETSYAGVFVYILIVAILIAFVMNIFYIISVKQKLDHCADQLVKQIQLNGGVTRDTSSLFSFLTSTIDKVDGLTYQIDCSDSSDKIQIGTPFYITVTGRCYLGGFWKLNLVRINIKAQGAGVSEHYWK